MESRLSATGNKAHKIGCIYIMICDNGLEGGVKVIFESNTFYRNSLLNTIHKIYVYNMSKNSNYIVCNVKYVQVRRSLNDNNTLTTHRIRQYEDW